VANAQMPIVNGSQFQGAASFTGGYRGRFPLAGGSGSEQEGFYVATNVNYLRGFRYEDENLAVRFDTDAAGLLTAVPGRPAPVLVARQYSTSGNGFAIDAGVGAFVNRWAVGFAANGIANRINWTGVSATTYFLSSLLTSDGDFSESATTPLRDVRVELPVEYRGNVAYFTPLWTATAEAGHGVGGASLRGGLERRWGRLAARGGARYTLQRWNPSAGIGFDVSRRIGFDVSAFGTTANIERKRRLALATSMRFAR
jgi:hypothetical protein